jgi:integrase
MTSRKRQAADLTGIRQRGARFQVRIFGGIDPATGRQLILTGSAATEAEALALRDGFRKQVADHTAVRTNVTLRVLLAEWLAGHQVEPSTRAGYALLIDNFIVPALGEQTLPALAKLGPRPYERTSVWVPRTLSPHVTCTYSCMRPPSRFRRSGWMGAPESGAAAPAGGC